jgi:IS30 family transposase
MARKHMQEAVDRHLRKVGSDIQSFLSQGLEDGRTPAVLADDLLRITSIEVAPRTIYRWIEDLEVAS